MESFTTSSESFPNPGKFTWDLEDIELVDDGKQETETISDPSVPPMCEVCVHNKNDFTCAAFPSGIPAAIYGKERQDHRQPTSGDGGITFKKNKRKNKKDIALILRQYQ